MHSLYAQCRRTKGQSPESSKTCLSSALLQHPHRVVASRCSSAEHISTGGISKPTKQDQGIQTPSLQTGALEGGVVDKNPVYARAVRVEEVHHHLRQNVQTSVKSQTLSHTALLCSRRPLTLRQRTCAKQAPMARLCAVWNTQWKADRSAALPVCQSGGSHLAAGAHVDRQRLLQVLRAVVQLVSLCAVLVPAHVQDPLEVSSGCPARRS